MSRELDGLETVVDAAALVVPARTTGVTTGPTRERTAPSTDQEVARMLAELVTIVERAYALTRVLRDRRGP